MESFNCIKSSAAFSVDCRHRNAGPDNNRNKHLTTAKRAPLSFVKGSTQWCTRIYSRKQQLLHINKKQQHHNHVHSNFPIKFTITMLPNHHKHKISSQNKMLTMISPVVTLISLMSAVLLLLLLSLSSLPQIVECTAQAAPHNGQQQQTISHRVRCSDKHMIVDIDVPASLINSTPIAQSTTNDDQQSAKNHNNRMTRQRREFIESLASVATLPHKYERTECRAQLVMHDNNALADARQSAGHTRAVLRFALPLHADQFSVCGTSRMRSLTAPPFYYNRLWLDSRLLLGAASSNENENTNNNVVEPELVLIGCSAPSSTIVAGVPTRRVRRQARPLSLATAGTIPRARSNNNEDVAGDVIRRRLDFEPVDDNWPSNFTEAPPELLDFSGTKNATGPLPILQAAIRQNGIIVSADTLTSLASASSSSGVAGPIARQQETLNVHPGTPLEMLVFLDDQSAQVYGLAVSQLKVTDGRAGKLARQETIVSNGCSIDPYIFGNFELGDSTYSSSLANNNNDAIASSSLTPGADKSLVAKFRAFKFPDSHYVMFVGTVNVCINVCAKTDCGNGAIGYGKRRRRRSTPPGTGNHTKAAAAAAAAATTNHNNAKPQFSVDLVTMIRIASDNNHVNTLNHIEPIVASAATSSNATTTTITRASVTSSEHLSPQQHTTSTGAGSQRTTVRLSKRQDVQSLQQQAPVSNHSNSATQSCCTSLISLLFHCLLLIHWTLLQCSW